MLSEGALAGDAARTAVGALREMLSALGNLQQLLRSRSVGPKALAPLLPEVVMGADPLLARLLSFWPALGGALHEGSALSRCRLELQLGLEKELAELKRTLGHSSVKPLGAGARLKAEAVVAKALRELGGSLALFELLGDLHQVNDAGGAFAEQPASERRWVDWVEALTLSRSGDQVQAPGCQLVQTSVVVRAEPRPLPLGPRAALNLAAVMSSCVLERGQPLRLVFEQAGPNAQLRVDCGPAEGKQVSLWVPPLLAATRSSLEAVAEARGLRLTLESGQVTMGW